MPDGGRELLHPTELSSGPELGSHIHSQLSQPTDVRSAYQFFQPNGTATLPDLITSPASGTELTFGQGNTLTFHGSEGGTFQVLKGLESLPQLTMTGTGAEASAASAFAGATPGLESTALMPGAESTALMPGMESALVPGSENAISPVIQLIMKLPGHIGLLSNFFDALMALFFPSPDLFAGLFNPATWLEHANAAMASLASLPGHLANLPGHLPSISMALMNNHSSFLQGLGQGLGNMTGSFGRTMADSAAQSTTSHVGNFAPDGFSFSRTDLNVSGNLDPGKPQFEVSSLDKAAGQYSTEDELAQLSFDKPQVAWDSTVPTFRPTLGGQQNVPAANIPGGGQATPSGLHHQAHPTHHSPAMHKGAAPKVEHSAAERGSLINGGKPHAHHAPGHEAVARGTDSSATTGDGGNYTVKPGDNLWDIAKNQFGDGTKWHDIYNVNTDAVGTNPDLIHPGLNLKMPDANALASGDKYVVQPGDNLWDIAKSHLGGGQHWGDIYAQNQGVIGGDPRLIHPGQELHLSGAGGSDIAHHAAPTHHVASNAHHAPAHHAPAHHAPAHHAPAHHAQSDVAHNAPVKQDQVADTAAQNTAKAAPTNEVAAGSQQVPRAMADSPGAGAADQGMKTNQQMGTLGPPTEQ